MTARFSRFLGSLGSGATLAAALLIAVALIGLVGVGIASAWADSAPQSATTPPTSAAELALASTVGQTQIATSSDDQANAFTQRVKDMMQEHMGLTGVEADEWASDMADHMRAVHGDAADEMLDACNGYWDGESSGEPGSGDYGPCGMMGGSTGMMSF